VGNCFFYLLLPNLLFHRRYRRHHHIGWGRPLPLRTIRAVPSTIIVPYPAGGPTDSVLARVLAADFFPIQLGHNFTTTISRT